MQNKGLIRILAVALTLVCLFYLSFTVVTSTYNKRAKEYAAGDKIKEFQYLDSLTNEKIWLGYTLKESREKEINLGLDLKGGMNVTLEVSVSEIINSLSGYNSSPNFTKALAQATERQKIESQTQYLDLFLDEYRKLDPNARLATVFSTYDLKEKISLSSTNDEVVEVLNQEIEGAISNSFNVLRTRIDRFGVVQPNIQRDNNNTGRILIELPGVKEPERVRKLLQGSANLEFWETYELSEIYNNLEQVNAFLAASVSAPAADTTKAATVQATAPVKKSKEDSLKAALTKSKTDIKDSVLMREEWIKNNPLFSKLQPSTQNGQIARGPVVGVAHSKDTADINAYFALKQIKDLLPRDLKLSWTVKAIDDAEEIFQLIAIKVTSRDGRAPLEGDVITDARADFSQTSAYANVSMTMDAEGSKTWARMTKDNIGKSIAISLDGFIYSIPTVNTEITGGSSQITGNFTVEEAKDLANTLNSGKMPAPARIVQEDIVGPSLGQEAINNGMISFIVAFVLVLLYMVLYYGVVPGIIADLALFANVFFLVGILASFASVLTLPGIAGIVLTMGMAVDANVLIFERIREELRSGKNMRQSIKEGYKNALSAIIDSNVTTLLTGIILMVFGKGPIKGFGVTLSIGIITTFITAVFLTRYMLDAYFAGEKRKEISFYTRISKNFLQNMKIDFMKIRKSMYILSLVLTVICFVSFFTKGFNMGIDFSGGRNYIVAFDHPIQTEEVKDLLEPVFEGEAPLVITIGNTSQVRISTKYKINENNPAIDNEIETKLYEGLKPLLKANTTKDVFVAENIKSSSKVGPTVADDIKTAAIWAVLFAILGIGLYILIRFREWGYTIGAVISLSHDAILALGMFSIFWGILPFSMEIDQSFIAAILTVLGYSINDTVVNYDRIRENTLLYPKRDRASIINYSVNQMLPRTFSTTFTTIITLIVMFSLGGDSIRGFIFAMLFGIVIGTYSSVFIASPITYEVTKFFQKRKDKKAAIVK